MLGSLFKGLFGSGGEGTAREASELARQFADRSVFQPFTVTTGTGQAAYAPETGFTSTLSPEMQSVLTGSLTGAQDVLSAFQGFDPQARSAEIFSQQSELLEPQFEQQAQRLQQSLFGSGRLGLRLAGESAGLGAGSGMVQPDALGLGRAQQQTLAQLASGSRQQAMQEYGQLGNLSRGLLSSALGITGQEQQLLGLGGTLEGMRGASLLGAGQLAISPMLAQAQLQQQSRGQSAGFFGGLFSAAMGQAGIPGLMGA